MRVCGSGGAVLNQALLQSKSYFEVKIQQGGYYSVGIALLETDLNRPRAGPGRWTLNAENYVMNNGQIAYDLNEMYSSNIISTENTATEQLLTPPPSSLASQRSPLPQEGGNKKNPLMLSVIFYFFTLKQITSRLNYGSISCLN